MHIVRTWLVCLMVAVLMACGADEQYIWLFKVQVNWQIQALGTGTNTDCT